MAERIVVALGGNALGKTPEEQLALVRNTARPIVDLVEKGYEVVIRDNGIGFDPKKQSASDEAGHHIGIANVRERIESMCGGSVTIDSEPDQGTKVTITVPAHG